VGFLLGITGISIPYNTLITAVITFVVIPLIAGYLTHQLVVKTKGAAWYKQKFLPKFEPVSVTALLITLILLFSYREQHILVHPLVILLTAIPLMIQPYFIFGLACSSGKWINLPYRLCAPGSILGATNFFELFVAVAIAI